MTTFKQARTYGYPTRFTVSRSQYGITRRPTCQTYRGTWAKWRERNTTGRDRYYARMERAVAEADRRASEMPVSWGRAAYLVLGEISEGTYWP